MLLWAGLGVLLVVAAVGVIVVVRHDERRELPPAPVPTPPPPPANLTPRPVSAAPNPTPAPRPAAAAPPAAAIPTPPPQPAFIPPPPEPMPTPPPKVAPSPKISAADLAEVQRLNSLGRPISALKLYREKTDATLAEAKAVLAGLAFIEQPPEAIVADLPPPPKTQSGHMPAMPMPAPPPATPPPAAAAPLAAPGTPAPSAPNPTPAPRRIPEPPPPPEVMTDEDDEEVRALIQWDRIDDAIKLYRHIHDVDLPTAQAAIKRLTRH